MERSKIFFQILVMIDGLFIHNIGNFRFSQVVLSLNHKNGVSLTKLEIFDYIFSKYVPIINSLSLPPVSEVE